MVLWSAPALADSCAALEGANLVNRCDVCMDVVLQELRPRDEVNAPLMRGEPRTIRVAASAQVPAPPGRFAITDLLKCE
jgi:hypothetical protein